MTYRKSILTGLVYVFAAFGLVQVIGFLLRMAQPYVPAMPAGPSTGGFILISFSPLQFFAFLLLVFGLVATWDYFRLRRKNRGAR